MLSRIYVIFIPELHFINLVVKKGISLHQIFKSLVILLPGLARIAKNSLQNLLTLAFTFLMICFICNYVIAYFCNIRVKLTKLFHEQFFHGIKLYFSLFYSLQEQFVFLAHKIFKWSNFLKQLIPHKWQLRMSFVASFGTCSWSYCELFKRFIAYCFRFRQREYISKLCSWFQTIWFLLHFWKRRSAFLPVGGSGRLFL